MESKYEVRNIIKLNWNKITKKLKINYFNFRVRKAFKCSCGKSYKTTHGLKNHAAIQHNGHQLKTLQINKLSKTGNTENENISGALETITSAGMQISLKAPKNKILAIEDHGYIKSERSILTETEIECDNDLGILTPASTPPLALHSVTKGEQPPTVHRSLHKYFTPSSVNTHRRHVKNEY